jgi:hypothetical protein
LIQRLEDFLGNTLFIYYAGFFFGAANGWLLRQMLKFNLNPVVSSMAIMLAVGVTVMIGLNGFNRSGDIQWIGLITPQVAADRRVCFSQRENAPHPTDRPKS